MKHLLTIRESDIFPEKVDLNPERFKERNAARAVVLNEVGEVALLKAHARSYHKLPGGGVETDENIRIALQRELMEEIGCEAEVVAEVGEIVEYRDRWEMKQISHCYLGRQVGVQKPPSFTQSEIDDGFEAVWAEDIDQAIELLEQDVPVNYDGLFIQRRDTELLKGARDILSQQ